MLTKKQMRIQAAKARAARVRNLEARKREQALRPFTLSLTTREAQWLYARLSEDGRGAGQGLAARLAAQSFGLIPSPPEIGDPT